MDCTVRSPWSPVRVGASAATSPSALGREGMRVALLGRDEATLDARLRRVPRRSAVDAMTVHADVTNDRQVRAAVAAVERPPRAARPGGQQRRSARDGAGATRGRPTPTTGGSTIETNLRGPFLLARAVLPAMIASRSRSAAAHRQRDGPCARSRSGAPTACRRRRCSRLDGLAGRWRWTAPG